MQANKHTDQNERWLFVEIGWNFLANLHFKPFSIYILQLFQMMNLTWEVHKFSEKNKAYNLKLIQIIINVFIKNKNNVLMYENK